MYGSAACIGLMMSYVIGYTEAQALEHAQKLGYAMQMTNFLRDIDEDFQDRGRIYMPQDELAQFGLSRADIEHRRFGASFQSFMSWQAQRCERLYEEANRGIAMLHPKGRLGVATASTLYRAILGKMEQRGWNPFEGRAATSLPEKIWLVNKARQLSRRVH
jgi:phytoene synthase